MRILLGLSVVTDHSWLQGVVKSAKARDKLKQHPREIPAERFSASYRGRIWRWQFYDAAQSAVLKLQLRLSTKSVLATLGLFSGPWCWQLPHGSLPHRLPPRGYVGNSGEARAR
jgi:hypothetical protein